MVLPRIRRQRHRIINRHLINLTRPNRNELPLLIPRRQLIPNIQMLIRAVSDDDGEGGDDIAVAGGAVEVPEGVLGGEEEGFEALGTGV